MGLLCYFNDYSCDFFDLSIKKCFKKENRNLNNTLSNYCVETESSCNSEMNQIEQTENILSYHEALQNTSLIEQVPVVDFHLPSYDQDIKMKRFWK